MKIGGFYDWNPFLLPLVLAVALLLAYGPARLSVVRALLWGQGLLSHGLERLPAVSRASPPFRWSAFHVVCTTASALFLLLFIYMEQYYRIGGCALDERWVAAVRLPFFHSFAISQ